MNKFPRKRAVEGQVVSLEGRALNGRWREITAVGLVGGWVGEWVGETVREERDRHPALGVLVVASRGLYFRSQ